MVNKQKIQKIKTDIERTIQGLRTKPQEFIYKQTRGFVKPNMLYSVYYTLSKQEVYLTGVTNTSNSKIITKVRDKTSFARYKDIQTLSRTPYPKPTSTKPSESDYRIGEITRYFTRMANDISKPILEISKEDFGNQNSLYKYTESQWRISGTKEEVDRDNRLRIRGLELDYPGISNILFPLQLWKPSKDSVDDLQKKLSLLRKT